MKNKLSLFLILLFVGIISTQAQQAQRRTVEERVKQTISRINDSLKLSTVQQADLDSILTEFYKGQDKLREGLTPGTRPERADIEKVSEIRDAKLKIILTEPQYNRYKEMEAAMRNRANRQRPPGQ